MNLPFLLLIELTEAQRRQVEIEILLSLGARLENDLLMQLVAEQEA